MFRRPRMKIWGRLKFFAEHEHHAAANQNNIVDYSVLNLNQDKARQRRTGLK